MYEEKVVKFLSEQLGLVENKVKLNSRIMEDLGADSLDVVEMLMELEEQFNIEVSDEQATNLKTVKDVVNLIENK